MSTSEKNAVSKGLSGRKVGYLFSVIGAILWFRLLDEAHVVEGKHQAYCQIQTYYLKLCYYKQIGTHEYGLSTTPRCAPLAFTTVNELDQFNSEVYGENTSGI